MKDIAGWFAKHENEELEFTRVRHKLSQRRDIHALLLLDRLMAGSDPMIYSVQDNDITLDIDWAVFTNSAVTEEQVLELVRCGVRCENNRLRMFYL